MWNALSTHIPGLHCGASTSHTNQNHHYRLQTHPHHLHHNFHHIDGSTETVRDNFGIQGLLDKDCSGEKETVRRSRFQRHFFQFVGWGLNWINWINWNSFPECWKCLQKVRYYEKRTLKFLKNIFDLHSFIFKSEHMRHIMVNGHSWRHFWTSSFTM